MFNNKYRTQLYAYEQFRISYYEKIKKNKIIILSDKKFLKKYNLSNDLSEWEGRRIKCFDCEDEIFINFVFMRKIYIPPVCVNYQDFIITCEQDLGCFKNQFNDDYKTRQINYILKENFTFEKDFEMFLNSLHNLDDTRVSNFSDILECLYDTLSLDYNSLNYFTNTIDVIGKEIYLLGLKFVYFILKEIRAIKTDMELELQKERESKNLYHLKTQNNLTIYEDNIANSSEKDTNSDFPILLGIEIFLFNIDKIIEVYEERYDAVRSQIHYRLQTESFSNLRLSEQRLEEGVVKAIFKEMIEYFSIIDKQHCKNIILLIRSILIF